MLNLGPDFDTAVLNLAGIDPSTVDMGSVLIPFVNQGGDTTIKATVMINVPTADLNQLIISAAQPTEE